ncbi:MAG: N-acetylmuramoyl-L-alanine amidase [Alphaproteobacteria bacterium]
MLVAFALLPAFAGPAATASLEAVRVGAHGDYTRLVLDTSRSLAPTIERPRATTVVLELAAAPAADLATAGDGLVERVAVARTPRGSRIELTLSVPARVRAAFALAPGDGRWHRYVVDLEADPAAAERAPLRVEVPAPDAAGPRRRPGTTAVVPKRRPPPEPPVVVVDAGHGGRDPGAIGPSGLEEKAVTLAVARALAERLRADGAIEVVLTRDDDRGLTLAGRLAIAAAHEADLFLSLHADSLPRHPKLRGASVYTLSAEASDAQAARKARKENAADARLEVIDAAPDETVRTILTSLMRSSTGRRSTTLAQYVATDLGEVAPLLRRPRRSANFVVLRSLHTPSVLVELGYLSNPQDEAALADPDHRDALAAALFRAVTAYLARG